MHIVRAEKKRNITSRKQAYLGMYKDAYNQALEAYLPIQLSICTLFNLHLTLPTNQTIN